MKLSDVFPKMADLDLGTECPEPVATALATITEKIAKPGIKVLEIGSWKGLSTSVMARIVKEHSGILFAVDHWKGSVGVPHLEKEAKQKDIFSIFQENLTSLGLYDVVKPMIMESQIASAIFPDKFFDLIFLDGDHRYSIFKKDLFSLLPKLKDNGIICGSCGDGYYTQYQEFLQTLINQNLETDYIAFEGIGVHPGIVKALFNAFQDRHQILTGQSFWYYQNAIDPSWAATRPELKDANAYYAAHVKVLLKILRPKDKKEEYNNLSEPERDYLNQTERIALVAQYCTQGWTGDLLLLGLPEIEITKALAKLARSSQCRLLIVPISKEETNALSSDLKEALFPEIEFDRDVVKIIQSDSLNPGTIALIKETKLCFALIDSFDTYEDCLIAIQTVAHCSGIIAIDNILHNLESSRAFLQGSEMTHRSKLYLPSCREGYLLWP